MNTDETPTALQRQKCGYCDSISAFPTEPNWVCVTCRSLLFARPPAPQPAAEPPWRPLEEDEPAHADDKWSPVATCWVTRRPLPSAPPDSGQALSVEEAAEINAHAKAVFCVGAALLRIEGDEGDPSRLVYSNNPMPEPYGSAWQAYEEQAETIVELLGATTAEKLAAPHLVTDSGQAANNFPQSPSRHSVRNSIAPDGSSPSSTGGREGCARGFDSLPVDSIQPTEPEPAPAQTAREWVEGLECQNFFGSLWVLRSRAIELASRAERAEAEAKSRNEHAERLAKMLATTLIERSKAQRERDRLREERDAAIAFIKELNATTNQHGRQYRSRCGQFLAALNQTTNQ